MKYIKYLTYVVVVVLCVLLTKCYYETPADKLPLAIRCGTLVGNGEIAVKLNGEIYHAPIKCGRMSDT